MIPILFRADETVFTSNGLGRLADCISCTVVEERNGIYECQFSYPVTGDMYDEIQEGCILGVIHDDKKDLQPFDIYARTAPINGVVTFFAHHVSYRLGNVILRPMSASSCAAAMAAIPNNTYNDCPFSFWTDKSVSATWTVDVPSAVKAVLGGQQGSILDVYGKGEYEWDKWAVKLHLNRGNDNGVSIRYGVNMTDLTHEYDISGVYNAVAPYWKSADGETVVTLPEGYILASSAETTLIPWTTHNGDFVQDSNGENVYVSTIAKILPVPMDLSQEFEDEPTEAQLYEKAKSKLDSSEAWLPNENLRVSFVDLAHTEDYKDVAALQRVSLCDRVSVYCGPLGVTAAKMQVIRVVYNVLTEMYDEIELGKAQSTLTDAIMADISQATADLPSTEQVKSMLEKAVDNATEQITGARGGHVRFIYDANGEMQEIVVMDTDSTETAVKVWRWNSGGLGFSSNGYAGPYSTAMTQDGQIVADFITTGELNADLIQAGHINANLIQGGTIDGESVNAKLLNIVDENDDVIASFDDVITLGLQSFSKTLIDFNSLEIVDKDNNPYFFVGDLREKDGYIHCVDTFTGDGYTRTYNLTYKAASSLPGLLIVSVDGTIMVKDTQYTVRFFSSYTAITFADAYTPADGAEIRITYRSEMPAPVFTLFNRNPENSIAPYSVSMGNNCTASGIYSFAIGDNTAANGDNAYAEGKNTVAGGKFSHAEGLNTHAGYGCHAEGTTCNAQGLWSHAEGDQTIASGYYSHSEGTRTQAGDSGFGTSCHAEGFETVASGSHSHAEGTNTVATRKSQHVFGEFNIADPSSGSVMYRGTYVEIVGKGTSESSRSNARTLDWSGNEWIAGTLTQASDARLKEDAGEIPDVSEIKAHRFRWTGGGHDDKDHVGYYAQDVEKVAPYLVSEDASGYKALDYIGLLCAKIDSLEKRIAQLEGRD